MSGQQAFDFPATVTALRTIIVGIRRRRPIGQLAKGLDANIFPRPFFVRIVGLRLVENDLAAAELELEGDVQQAGEPLLDLVLPRGRDKQAKKTAAARA